MIIKKEESKKRKKFFSFNKFLYFYFFSSLLVFLFLSIFILQSYTFQKIKNKYLDLFSKAGRYEYLYLPQITYKALKPYVKTPSFSENLLKLLGFADKDTKMLMAVTTAKKSIIIDKHPDLDVSNIDLKLSGVSILVVGPTGKTIVSFGVKEGERKALAGKVSFASVEPVDLANYAAFEEE